MRRVMILMAVAAILLMAPAASALAQQTPEQAAEAYMSALKQNRIDDFVAMMHPLALDDFKKMMLPLAKMASEKGKEDDIMGLFKGLLTAKDMEKAAPDKVFKAFYSGLLEMIPNLQSALAGSTMKVVGHVKEGADVAHVVYRATVTVGGVEMRRVEVMTMKLSSGKWMAMLTGNIEGLAAQIRRQMSQSLKQ